MQREFERANKQKKTTAQNQNNDLLSRQMAQITYSHISNGLILEMEIFHSMSIDFKSFYALLPL